MTSEEVVQGGAEQRTGPTASEGQDASGVNPEDAKGASETAGVYDSEARQRIPVTLLLEGERYEVALVQDPVRDETLREYARRCEQANAAESAEEEEAGAGQIGAALNVVAWLFNALMSDIEGVGEEGEEKPPDWRDIFGAQEKAAVIDRTTFGLEVIAPPPAAKGKRPKWTPQLRSVITRLRVPFDGRVVEVSHTLRKADAARVGEFATLYARALGATRGLDAQMENFAAGYDALHVAHENYSGAVPMHHKAVAYIAHMTRQGAAVRKN